MQQRERQHDAMLVALGDEPLVRGARRVAGFGDPVEQEQRDRHAPVQCPAPAVGAERMQAGDRLARVLERFLGAAE